MFFSKHFQVTIDPGEKYHLFSQSALDELIANYVNLERERCAYRAGVALLGADRELANRVERAIRARGQQ